MKKLIKLGAVIAMAFSSAAYAELEISGNVTTGAGYQHDSVNAPGTVDANSGTGGAGGLTMGDLRFNPGARADHYGTFVDQAEVDLENEFGENIRARFDVDFFDLGTPSVTGLLLEQAYVTANIAVGNGMEFLAGKFNAPVGLESKDRHENVFATYTPGFVFLTPRQVMGGKIYYDFNDHWNLDLALVDSMIATLGTNSPLPSGILRVGANWGDEGRESFWHLAAGFGPEHNAVSNGAAEDKHFDYAGVMWGNWALGDYWDLGWEGNYHQTNSVTGGTDQKAIAGQIYGVYQASDVWTLQLRGAIFWELDPTNAAGGGTGASTTGTTFQGFEGMNYSGTAGATYQITDGADVKFEYRFDLAKTDAAGTADANFHTGVVQFAYSF